MSMQRVSRHPDSRRGEGETEMIKIAIVMMLVGCVPDPMMQSDPDLAETATSPDGGVVGSDMMKKAQGDMATESPDMTPPCGHVGEACCQNNICYSQPAVQMLWCEDHCLVCGKDGQHVCPSGCQEGQNYNGTCMCGGIGQPCCPNTKCKAGSCGIVNSVPVCQ